MRVSAQSFGQEMQRRAQKRRNGLRKQLVNRDLPDASQSPVKHRRALLLDDDSGIASFVRKIKRRIEVVVQSADVSLNVCYALERLEKDADPMACFYLGTLSTEVEVFRCLIDDMDFVVENTIEALLGQGLRVDRFPPLPMSPMPIFKIGWYNLGEERGT